MRRFSIVGLAACGQAAADPGFDPATAWNRWWPMSRTGHLVELSRVELPPDAQLVAAVATGAIVDRGREVDLLAPGGSQVLAHGRGPIARTAWTRGGEVRGLTAAGELATFTPTVPPSGPSRLPDPAVVVAGATYYTSSDALVRSDGNAATTLAPLGRDYMGALATDGRDVFVADRDALWKWDVARGERSVLPMSLYWPADLAARPGRLLIDVHGHGAIAVDPAGAHPVELDTRRMLPTGALAWVGDTALVVASPPRVHHLSAIDATDDDDSDSVDAAIFCWRSERGPVSSKGERPARLHRLYQARPRVTICRLATAADRIAWTETEGDDCQSPPLTLVQARLRGACE
jgi:hypothetical protein